MSTTIKNEIEIYVNRGAASIGIAVGILMVLILLWFFFNIHEGREVSIFAIRNIVLANFVVIAFKTILVVQIIYLLLMVRVRIFDFFRLSPIVVVGDFGLNIRRWTETHEVAWNDVKSYEFVPYKDGSPILNLRYFPKNKKRRCKTFRLNAANLSIGKDALELIFEKNIKSKNSNN